MSLSYSTIAWGASAHNGCEPDVSYDYMDTIVSNHVFGVFNSLGQITFAYARHNVVLEIQATIPTIPEKPSKIPMWRGVVVAYIVVDICYFPVALVVYWAFGQTVGDNVLITLDKPRWLIAMKNLMVVVHVIESYQIYAMRVFNMIETVLVKKWMATSLDSSICLCCIHLFCWPHITFLWGSAWFIWRILLLFQTHKRFHPDSRDSNVFGIVLTSSSIWHS